MCYKYKFIADGKSIEILGYEAKIIINYYADLEEILREPDIFVFSNKKFENFWMSKNSEKCREIMRKYVYKAWGLL